MSDPTPDTTTLTIRADLKARLEALAAAQHVSVDAVLEGLLPPLPETPVLPDTDEDNWATRWLATLETLKDEQTGAPETAEESRAHFEAHLRERWDRIERQYREETDAEHSG